MPSDWPLLRLKTIASIRPSNVDKKTVEGEPRVRLCNYTDVYYRDRIHGALDLMRATASHGAIQRFRLRKGDVLITKDSESRTDIAVPAYVDEDLTDVVCGYHLTLIRPDRTAVSGRFLHYCFLAEGIRDQFYVAAAGITRFGLSARAIADACFPVPHRERQAEIVRFLDRETAHIDRLIERKERLISLLEEKRSALITWAVTKGLDPGVPMKDSGVEWIGELPEHWDVAPVGALYEVQLGKMLDSSQQTGEHARPYLRNQDVLWDQVQVAELPEMDFLPSDRARFRLREGDLLVCEGGDVGRTAVWRGGLEECYYQKAIHRVRARHEGAWPRFLYYVMWHFSKRGVFLAGGNPNTIPHLTAVQLRGYRIPTPPVEEQRAVSAHLDDLAARLTRLVEKVRRGISLLRERRSALITAAVTGQIDVSEYETSRRAPVALEAEDEHRSTVETATAEP